MAQYYKNEVRQQTDAQLNADRLDSFVMTNGMRYGTAIFFVNSINRLLQSSDASQFHKHLKVLSSTNLYGSDKVVMYRKNQN